MSVSETKSKVLRQGEATRRAVLGDSYVESTGTTTTAFDAPF